MGPSAVASAVRSTRMRAVSCRALHLGFLCTGTASLEERKECNAVGKTRKRVRGREKGVRVPDDFFKV